MRGKKFWLFVIGVLFILAGFFVGKPSDENVPVLDIKDTKPSLAPLLSKKNTYSSSESRARSRESREALEEVIIDHVLDGDTIIIKDGKRIRYLGINAPEKGQPFSSESTVFNRNMVLGKSVGLEFDVQTKDRYGRTLAYVFVGNTFVNLEMVKNGLAVSETIQPNVKYQDDIVEAQKIARENCFGIWKGLCNKEGNEVLGEKSKSCIIISSINADAKGNDNQNKNGEWIEIKNTCSELASLDKWLLKDNSASNKYQFSNVKLVGGKSIGLYSGCGQDSEGKLYWQCPEGKYAIWNNAGDHAFLYNEKGELVSDYQY